MTAKKKTGFDKYFERRLEEPAFAEAFEQARSEIVGSDSLIRAVEGVLVAKGMSKAEMARHIGAKPESVRRLLTDTRGNPTLSTILKVLKEVGLHLEVAPNASHRKVHEARAGA